MTKDRKPDKTHAGSVDGDLDAMRSAALGAIEPPEGVKLRDCDLPIWRRMMLVRARDEWSDIDLMHAANLTRCLVDIELISAEIQTEGNVSSNDRGTRTVNPKHALLEVLSRRAVTLTKMLHLHASALRGDPRDAAAGRAKEAEARGALNEMGDEDDGLLATPTAH